MDDDIMCVHTLGRSNNNNNDKNRKINKISYLFEFIINRKTKDLIKIMLIFKNTQQWKALNYHLRRQNLISKLREIVNLLTFMRKQWT